MQSSSAQLCCYDPPLKRPFPLTFILTLKPSIRTKMLCTTFGSLAPTRSNSKFANSVPRIFFISSTASILPMQPRLPAPKLRMVFSIRARRLAKACFCDLVTFLQPPLRDEGVGVRAEDGSVAVDDLGVHADYCAGFEEAAAREAETFLRDDALEVE